MITLPLTRWDPAVIRALDMSGRPWRPAWVIGSDTAYCRLLTDLWAKGGFTVVEHDVIVTREVLDSFDDCPADWCASRYPYVNGWIFAGLGCARFTAAITTRHPDLMQVVAEMSDATHPAGHWCRLDAWITNTLTARGEHRCENHPSVQHAMTDPGSSAHGCFTG